MGEFTQRNKIRKARIGGIAEFNLFAVFRGMTMGLGLSMRPKGRLQSQGDCIIQPRVGPILEGLPWVESFKFPNPERVE
jgi:hypothetical protein